MIEIIIRDNELLATEGNEIVGKIVFERTEKLLAVLHTYAYQSGRGIGSILMKEAINYAKSNNLELIPVCSFAVKYLQKYPQ